MGGANRVAMRLQERFLARGLESDLFVGLDEGTHARAHRLPHDNYRRQNRWTSLVLSLRPRLYDTVARNEEPIPSKLLRLLAEPTRYLHRVLGHEDFCYPATQDLLQLAKGAPQVVLCHNLHGGYVDLRALPQLSEQVPFILTIHDLWLITGGCSYPLECDRWRSGCGHCPHREQLSSRRRDGTAYNWSTKKKIYKRSRLYVSAPSSWTLEKVRESTLADAVADARVIPNGVDLEVFCPGDKNTARRRLGLPMNATVLLTTGAYLDKNRIKNVGMIFEAAGIAAKASPERRIIVVALGSDGNVQPSADYHTIHTGYIDQDAAIANYYQAADLYLHSAIAETWCLAVTQALACGKPVVTTNVGGIRDQILSLDDSRTQTYAGVCKPTGILINPGDIRAMAQAIGHLVREEELRAELGKNAVREAGRLFGINRQVDTYLDWFSELA
jgi:glycosyltransferase involved in cell wall biosynthesis